MSSFLQEYQRQPKLFIDLPSQGIWYDDTVIENNRSEQLPVFGMNAMDEILFKTPDALFTGEATAQVIKSCIPSILDPWRLVGYDIDFILIALRIATYGDSIDLNTECPKCQTKNEHTASLNVLLQGFNGYQTSFNFELNGFKFNLKPITYKRTTDFSIEHYTYNRELYQIEKLDLSPEEKNKMSQELYAKSAQLNVRIALSHVESIEKDGNSEVDQEQIISFITNNDVEFYERIKSGISDLTSKWNIPAFDAECSGCGHKFKSAIELDYSNFFGVKSLISRNLL
jgi:hypothetical protein